MKTPKKLNLYEWKDYCIFRSLILKPFPSPRVWDNALTLGWAGGRYKKQKYFDLELFVPCISQKTMDKYGGYLEQTDGCHAINKSNQKDVDGSSKLFLNVRTFMETNQPLLNIDYETLNEIILEIYFLLSSQTPSLDCGFVISNYSQTASNKAEQNWLNLNNRLQEELHSSQNLGYSIFDALYTYVEEFFGCSSKDLREIDKKLKNKFWFIEMFNFSFKSSILEELFVYKQDIPETFTDEIHFPEEIYDSGDNLIDNIEKQLNHFSNSFNKKKGDLIVIPSKKDVSDKIKKFGEDIKHLKADLNNNFNKFSNNSNNDLGFIPSKATIPDGFESLGDDVKDLKFALKNHQFAFKSFFNDREFIKNGAWMEDTLFCPPFDEPLYCKLIKENHRYTISQINSRNAYAKKKSANQGLGLGTVIGILGGNLAYLPFTAIMTSNAMRSMQNNIDLNKPLRDFLPDPYFLFASDSGSFINLSQTFKFHTNKRRLCIKKQVLANQKVYFELIPMILFENHATPAQIFRLENNFYLRPIAANYDLNNRYGLDYNPIKIRRSIAYNPQKDIEKIAKIMNTRILGETIDKQTTIFYAWFRNDSSLNHFYFDYSIDGQLF